MKGRTLINILCKEFLFFYNDGVGIMLEMFPLFEHECKMTIAYKNPSQQKRSGHFLNFLLKCQTIKHIFLPCWQQKYKF